MSSGEQAWGRCTDCSGRTLGPVTYENGIPTQDNAKVANAIQRYVIEHSRLGIPVLLAEECPHGHQALDGTLLPVNTAIGSTWNPELIERAYSQVASEIPRPRGSHRLGIGTGHSAGSAVGTLRECYGEDPYLVARMTEAVVHGMQGRARRAEAPGQGGDRA